MGELSWPTIGGPTLIQDNSSNNSSNSSSNSKVKSEKAGRRWRIKGDRSQLLALSMIETRKVGEPICGPSRGFCAHRAPPQCPVAP
jgi:hypothetical protein